MVTHTRLVLSVSQLCFITQRKGNIHRNITFVEIFNVAVLHTHKRHMKDDRINTKHCNSMRTSSAAHLSPTFSFLSNTFLS